MLLCPRSCTQSGIAIPSSIHLAEEAVQDPLHKFSWSTAQPVKCVPNDIGVPSDELSCRNRSIVELFEQAPLESERD